MKPSVIKIAHIGGGSRYWARDLLAELAQTGVLTGQVDLYDLNYEAAKKNVAVADAFYSRPEAKARFKVRAVRKLKDALQGADFVVLSIEPGPTSCRFADLEIPARYGIYQSVGDTTGPGGIARALRSIPLYTDFAQQIAEHCPNAWVINYTNPMTLCTAALYAAAPKIKAFGCCHEVFHTQDHLATLVAEWFKVPTPARSEINVDIAGINHFTWITAATWQGHDLMPRLKAMISEPGFFRSKAALARKRVKEERWFECSFLVAYDLLKRYGVLGAAGDRHLAEFVPWYLTDETSLHRYGAILTPYSWRLKRSQLVDNEVEFYRDRPLKPSGEEGMHLIEALAGHRTIRSNVNLPNTGQIPTLPLGHVVETNAHFGKNKAEAVKAGDLPAGPLALVRRVVDVQHLTLQAALNKDVDLAFQALLADPLVRISTDDAWKMFTEMLHHLQPQLKGWRLP